MTIAKRSGGGPLGLALALLLASGCGGVGADREAPVGEELIPAAGPVPGAAGAPAVFRDSTAEPEAEVVPEEAPAAAPRPASRAPARAEGMPEPAAREPRTVTYAAAVGAMFAVTLNQTLSTETNQVGDLFTASLGGAITDERGEVVVPAGALVRGRLTQVEKSGHMGETGVIALAFESIAFDGHTLALDATVMKASPQRKSRASTQEQAGKVAVGAAAGAVLGRVLGKDTKGTITGAVIGAAAGTAIAMGTADVDVVLPAGSDLVLRLDAPLEVRRMTY